MQFLFGDDGLDPVAMEAKKGGGPLDFEHLLAAVPPFCPARKSEGAELDITPTSTFKASAHLEETVLTSLHPYIYQL